MSNPETQSIVVDYDLPQSPDKVWRALTDPVLLGAWLMPNDFVATVGHRIQFKAPPSPGWDGIVYCEVLEVMEPKRLRYSWRGGSHESPRYGLLDTIVSWTLEPSPTGGTRLRLEHSGFLAKDAFAFSNMEKGWREHVARRMTEAIAKL